MVKPPLGLANGFGLLDGSCVVIKKVELLPVYQILALLISVAGAVDPAVLNVKLVAESGTEFPDVTICTPITSCVVVVPLKILVVLDCVVVLET